MFWMGHFKALPSASCEFVVSTRASANETQPWSPGMKVIANNAVGTPGAYKQVAGDSYFEGVEGRAEAMELTKQEIIEKLKLEKSILTDGGYGRSVRTPWRPTEYFRDSISCLNVGESEKVHPCTDCFLIDYVHPAHRDKDLPCHMIPLNTEGETIYSLMRIGDVEKLEQLLLEWLDTTIEREQKPHVVKSTEAKKDPV
jgi:hypothetical protein